MTPATGICPMCGGTGERFNPMTGDWFGICDCQEGTDTQTDQNEQSERTPYDFSDIPF